MKRNDLPSSFHGAINLCLFVGSVDCTLPLVPLSVLETGPQNWYRFEVFPLFLYVPRWRSGEVQPIKAERWL